MAATNCTNESVNRPYGIKIVVVAPFRLLKCVKNDKFVLILLS